MATKPKSRVSNNNSKQLTQFKFRWWMALILVAVIAIIGIVIIRFSHASSVTKIYADTLVTGMNYPNGCPSYNGQSGSAQLTSSGQWCLYGTYQSGLTRFRRINDGQCSFMQLGANNSKGQYLKGGAMPIGKGAWVTVSETTSCNV